MTVVLWVLAVVLVIVGLIGVVLPAVPGTILVFAGLVLAAWADGFARVGFVTLTVLGVLAAASYGIDFIAAAVGASRDVAKAGQAGIAAWIGFAIGMAVKVALVFVMSRIFIAAFFLF